MFFEASSIGCRKMKFDETKVTYNVYSCDTCCMSREMIEMDGRESAMCQNPREGTWMAFVELFNEDETKECIVVFSFFKKETKM